MSDTLDDSTFTTEDLLGDSPAPESVEVTDEAPVEFDGQGEVTDVTPEPQVEYFDPLAEAAGKVAKVKVDGEELDVPVEDLVAGYQRQADYTRKTQELAKDRDNLAFWQQVDQAMKVNPEATLGYLQQQYGMTPQQVEDSTDDWDSSWEADDPVAKRLQHLEQLVAPATRYIEEQQAAEQLDRTVKALSSKYGDEFDATEVIGEAVNRGIHDPAALEMVYRDMAFERYRAQAAAQQFSGQAKQESEAQRQAAAAEAVAATSAGPSSRGSAADPTPKHARTVQEAWEMAKLELGIT